MTDPYEPPPPARRNEEQRPAGPPAQGQWGSPQGQWGSPQGQWGTAPSPGHGYPAVPAGYGTPPPPAVVVPSWALASPWVRLGASLLNVVLLVVTLVIGYLVWTLVLWNQGTNPGKKMCGLTVVKADTGRTCNFNEMLVRNVVLGGLVMSFVGTLTLGIGGLVDALMIFGDRRQRLVDKMAGTLVVVSRR